MAARNKAAGRKSAPTPVTDSQVHAITHTARMLAVLNDPVRSTKNQAGKKKEYDYVIEGYRRQWAGFSPEVKKSAKAAATDVADMDSKSIAAAVAALEE